MDSTLILAITLGTVAATTLMTVFSHVVGRLRSRQFTEPVLLNRLLLGYGVSEEYRSGKNPLGWIIHYVVGLMFLLAYHFIWSGMRFDPTFSTSLILGCCSGVIAIIGWSILFKIKSVPPDIRLDEYYTQLFLAHVIFAVVATGVFRLVT